MTRTVDLIFDPLLTGEGVDPEISQADLRRLRDGGSVLLQRPGFDDVWLEPDSCHRTRDAEWIRYVQATPVAKRQQRVHWAHYVAASMVAYAVGIVTGVCLA